MDIGNADNWHILRTDTRNVNRVSAFCHGACCETCGALVCEPSRPERRDLSESLMNAYKGFLTGKSGSGLVIGLFLALVATGSAQGATSEIAPIHVAPGESVVLGEPAPCTTVEALEAKYGKALVATTTSGQQVIYTAPANRVDEFFLHVQQASTPPKNGVCDSPKTLDFRLTVDPTPSVSNETLAQAFRLLLLAFVVATLLESAFALVFNWRFFQEFFVGRAWRSLIMFLGSYGVVTQFNLDVMGALVRAYDPGLGLSNTAASSGFSKFLSAMILAGGSSGINQVLVALGFRALVRPDTEKRLPEQTEGWVAVQVKYEGCYSNECPAQVDLKEVVRTDLQTDSSSRRLVSSLEHRGLLRRTWNVFFPSLLRFPRSGGYSLSPDKFYRLTVTWKSGSKEHIYDPVGKQSVGKADEAQVFSVAPRALVDFLVTIET